MIPTMWMGLLALLLGAAAFIAHLLSNRQEKIDGAAIEAGKTSAVTVKAEAAISQAMAEAPDTKAELIDRLNKGGF